MSTEQEMKESSMSETHDPASQKMEVFVCSAQEWQQLFDILGNCPAKIVAEACMWMKNKKAVTVMVNKETPNSAQA